MGNVDMDVDKEKPPVETGGARTLSFLFWCVIIFLFYILSTIFLLHLGSLFYEVWCWVL